jgi:hypothetical protein
MAEPDTGRGKQTGLSPGEEDARFEAMEQKHT